MKARALLIAFCVSWLMTGCTPETRHQRTSRQDEKIAELEAKLQAIRDKEEADRRLGQYAINMMFKSRRTVDTLSLAVMQVLAQSIVRVSNDIFDNENERHGFIGALQIESEFLKYAQSPTGPKGLSQVARATFHMALARCGIPAAKDDDVWETELNLYAGACYYKEQLIANNGDVVAAIVSYNQGPASKDAKTYAKNGRLEGIEPLKYVARFVFNMRNTTSERAPNAPSIDELPRATKPTKEALELTNQE
jgi:hypothetical protein